MGALKQSMIGIPFFCRRCDEMLADGQITCPFCDHQATPIDELADDHRAELLAEWNETNGPFGVGA